MAAKTGEEMQKETCPHSSRVDNLDFSIDSLQLGDSTRSLLSPLYGKDDASLKEQSISSSDESISEGDAKKPAKRDEATYSECSFEESDSDTTTVKKNQRKIETNSSNGSSLSSSSDLPTQSDGVHDIQPQLSPWEKWLLTKVIEDHKNARGKTKKKLLEKEMRENEIALKVEKEKKVEANRQQWLELKNREEKKKKKVKKQQERLNAEQRQLEREKIEELSAESFQNWTESKSIEEAKKRKANRLDDRMKRKEERERKERSEAAYEKWLERAKQQPKLRNNHFGYLSGRVTGYYDWTCYPMPAYTNPAPWVGPKIKKHTQGTGEVQCASPPLLFKELEQRERKQKNLKLKNRKNLCK